MDEDWQTLRRTTATARPEQSSSASGMVTAAISVELSASVVTGSEYSVSVNLSRDVNARTCDIFKSFGETCLVLPCN